MTDTVYEHLGARRIINGMGFYTKLGGSIISPSVWAKMTEANEWMVEMGPMLDASGEYLARLVGAEAARVVPGVAAGLALGVAGCIARGDEDAAERLPDVSGLPSAVVVQAVHRYKYLRAAWLSGAHAAWVGSEEQGATAEELDVALGGEGVAAMLYPAHLEGRPGAVPLAEASRLARARGVPVVIDAAFLSYPTRLLARFADLGDLVCISAKYFYGPNGGGFVYGYGEHVGWLAALDFTRFELTERRTFGRAFKLDRHTVVGTIAALEEWLTMDHEERLGRYRQRVRVLEAAVWGIPGVRAEPKGWEGDESLVDEPVNSLVLHVDAERAGQTIEEVHAALHQGDPSIVSHLEDDGYVIIAVEAMSDGQEQVVAARLREVLSSVTAKG